METVLQPKARPFESLKRKRFREWLRPSTARGSLIQSDTLNLHEFSQSNCTNPFSDSNSVRGLLVTTPTKYKCQDEGNIFSRGENKFETLFSNRKFYEFKDNLKRGFKKMRHRKNENENENKCSTDGKIAKLDSDNFEKSEDYTPCFNKFSTKPQDFETQFDYANKNQGSNKTYLDNESCWNLSERLIPFNNLKYEDLKHFEENLQSLAPVTFTPIESNESLVGSDSTRGTKRSIRNDSSDIASEKRICLKQYLNEPRSDDSMESTPSIYITKEVQQRIEVLSSTDSFFIEKVDFTSNSKADASISDDKSYHDSIQMDEEPISNVNSGNEKNIDIADPNSNAESAAEKPTEVSSVLKDRDIDAASSSYSDEAGTTPEVIDSDEISDLSGTSSSDGSKVYTIPTFRGLSKQVNISQILSNFKKESLTQDKLTHLIKNHQNKKKRIGFKNKKFYDAFNPYLDSQEEIELADIENTSPVDIDQDIKDSSTSSVRFDHNSHLLIYKKSKKSSRGGSQGSYVTAGTRSILKAKKNFQHDEESQRASKCDTVGVAQFLHYFQYTEYKRQRNEAENYRLRGEQLSKYYSEEYPPDILSVEGDNSINDKSEIISSMRATERNIGRQLKGVGSQGAQIISLDEDVLGSSEKNLFTDITP
ncbi:hypothetical protein SEUBUCD646_0D02570 [Saccharomyces eubayanus]|uniref:GIP1-like protein n=1 Tax=Saccharomyces eubayanus TaxID=1080349 RepID=A0ABN8VPB0_SACEU|nr:GIP1-like protein [Saccharomyces eubayanus]KOH00369.1 GIP1-like protein [Saccharomyces eubayanus]CAI1910382.1 hypothetical protein SEUBUCD650_0D02560 [Saccharomyces eubayanus]CAI1943630.1 hypothetical protein SEUBUCD646_0D02570 [Saccharomyces eubayanus]